MRFASQHQSLRRQPALEPASRRKYQRYPANWPARCMIDGQPDRDLIIENASEGGFGLHCTLPVEIGDQLVLSVAQIGVFPCRLAWKSEDRCGVQFLREEGHLSAGQISGLSDALLDF